MLKGETEIGPDPAGARRLATIERVVAVAPIPEADAIVRATIRGWDVVVKVGEFTPGDLCVYFEVDSLLDVEDPRFAFLAPRGVRTDAWGRRGHVLKTVRLRGQYSQGLALPVAEFYELGEVGDGDVGRDVTEILGVVKWDPPIPASLAGEVWGLRPSWVPKTDEERIQNLPDILRVPGAWEATEKIDGSSVSFTFDGERFGVCSRNLDLKESDGNTLWRLARSLDMETRLRSAMVGQRMAVQGEAYGEGIQGNPLKVKGQRFAAFGLVVDGIPMPRSGWPDWLVGMSVPVHDLAFPVDVAAALAQVERLDSAISPGRPAEGVVWRRRDVAQITLPDGTMVRASFKVISNRYLLKHDQ